ncbi:MAG: NAD(P)H-dependent oxidoreductase subunit E [Pseudomonadota bacterium]
MNTRNPGPIANESPDNTVRQGQNRPRHPGKGTRRGRHTSRGRQLEPAALSEVRALLGDRPRHRDLLIEFLHLIQDKYGHLSARHLTALAEEMRLAQVEVYEVATFYAHFDVVRETDTPPPPLTIRVCDSLTCAMMGAGTLEQTLKSSLNASDVRVVRAPCMGRCAAAPVAEIGHRHLAPATPAGVRSVIKARKYKPVVPDTQTLANYRSAGGFSQLEACRDGDHTPQDVIDSLLESGLRGLGGAGFPTGRKWTFVREAPAPRYLCVNADEGEPGTFKDRHYLETGHWQFFEGVLIAAWVIEAERCYIYLRDEYPGLQILLREAIATLEAAKIIEAGFVELRRGAGAYICGEESSMIESLEGKRGLPRHRPPYVAQNGLFGRPTLVNNVETLYWVPVILGKGATAFAEGGRHGSKGLRSYSVSGRVREPGVKVAPAGITANELIEEFCGGMAPGHEFLGYLPGGASGGILPASMADLPLDFGKLEQYGCFVGSHAVIVLSHQDDMKAAALNLMRFFEDESCGQCTPCRAGTEKAVKLMEGDRWDVDLLHELGQVMTDASICGLGQAAANPLKCLIKYFPEAVQQ